ncbi:metalloregulator ArsR/SmtB family transcription factor [Hymenobacter sp. DH14]|uniref:Metalloregulator ArsR/SmtB family transcription factor n=1 Tax=Hymenobacter cyanobacteriorum TaxID=2926463 RepID=A0A9X2AHB6_9BACT|nr:metalloregulator ArsR/SmtB family transcription factor [Hymenobacter cyanobacteriorum]MCI1189667.1 metalloregulator ArsR/SmtB family transcription factor [Hymenobacter cyanobacteriorum]
MNGNKGTRFSADEQAVAVVAKALGHPARVAIVRLLATRATCTTGELVAELPLSQSTVSQHLKELKAAGLVESVPGSAREGYALSPSRWAQVRQLFGTLLGELPPAGATLPLV